MMLLRKIYYLLSPSIRRLARRFYYFPIDLLDSLTGKQLPMVPPKGKIFIGPGDFVKIGDNFLTNFIELCELRPNSKVLDIGCGIGRIARPLKNYLNLDGSYDGFDIVKKGIDWCKKEYVTFPNFHFKFIPLRNDLYNLSTQNVASKFIFPYPDQHFDLVILTSVFTHMQETEVENYIGEISRVLKKGKYCFCSFFFITSETETFLNNSNQPFFKYKFENYFLHDAKVKDANIAFRYEFITKIIENNKLKIKNYYPGWWAGRKKEDCLNFQDIMIITN